MDLPCCVVTCTDGSDMALAVELISWFFCVAGGFGTDVGCGNIFICSPGKEGSTSMGYGG
jgi:hypothetical protein